MITLRHKSIHKIPLDAHRVRILLYFVHILGKNVREVEFKSLVFSHQIKKQTGCPDRLFDPGLYQFA